jgi:hypothetical protein
VQNLGAFVKTFLGHKKTAENILGPWATVSKSENVKITLSTVLFLLS